MFFRTLKGLSLSLVIGTVCSVSSGIIAVLAGVGAAIGPKWLDSFILFLIDMMLGIPQLVLLLLISFAMGGGFAGLITGIAVTHWPSLARVIRAETLSIRGNAYISVSRKLGHSRMYIMRKHILPHILPQFIVGTVLLFPHAILHESALTFLGFGLPPEQPAIGIILSESMRYLAAGEWWLAVFPGVLLVALVILMDRIGRALKEYAQ
jgi:peptide/nickel transport system permease protein